MLAQAGEGKSYQYSTIDFPPDIAFKSWANEVRSNVTKLEIRSQSEDSFSGWFAQRSLGPLQFSTIQASQQDAFHDADKRSNMEDRFDLVYMRSGQMSMKQDGHQALVGADEFLLVNHMKSFSFSTSRQSQCFLLSCPMSWLHGWLPDPEACEMRVMSGRDQWATLIGGLLKGIGHGLNDAEPLPEALIADQIGGSLALVYDGFADNTTGHRRKLRHHLLRSIRAQHADWNLSPGDIATQHRISLRYLHALFSSAETTFGRELLAIRLDRMQALLSDATCSKETIGEIAHRCGFKDPAHMARRFRGMYGMSPTVFRQGK